MMLIFIASCNKVKYTSDPLDHRAYVWNRQTSDSLSENIRYSNNFLDGHSILAAEISWIKERPIVAYTEIPKETSGIDSISIRVNDYRGLISSQTDYIKRITQKALEKFTKSGFKINEIQIDFDCPSSKLNHYAEFLKSFRVNFKQKISITALPSWLKNKSFETVINSCDEYVLQLHSLVLPKSINEINALFEQKKASKWLSQAAQLGRNFSISLPTYGYYLGFDEQGNYLGVSSEQGPKNWPQSKVLLTDRQEVQSFVQELSRKRPDLLKSIYWFRLHNDKDKLNWNVDAIRNTINGKTIPEKGFEIVFKDQNKSLLDISLKNNSNYPIVVPKSIKLPLKRKKVLFVDILSEFKITKSKEYSLILESRNNVVIAPGKTLAIGWVRFEESTAKEKS